MYWLICFLTDRKCCTCNFVPQVKDTVICTSPPPPPSHHHHHKKTTTIQPRNICENCVFTNISGLYNFYWGGVGQITVSFISVLCYNFSLSGCHFSLIFLEGDSLLPTVRAQLEPCLLYIFLADHRLLSDAFQTIFTYC